MHVGPCISRVKPRAFKWINAGGGRIEFRAAMPAYFFHVRDSAEIIDRDGVDCAGIEEARAVAVKAAAEALRDLGGKFWNAPECRLHSPG